MIKTHLNYRNLLETALTELLSKKPENITDITKDYSNYTLIFPTAKSKRRFSEIFTRNTSSSFPPKMITLSRLPEEFYKADQKIVSNFQMQSLIADSIKEIKADDLKKLFPILENNLSIKLLHKYSKKLINLYAELSGFNKSFQDLEICYKDNFQYLDFNKYAVINNIFNIYLKKLNKLNLTDKYQLRKDKLIENKLETKNIFLIGIIDLNTEQLQFLEQSKSNIDVFIKAEQSLTKAFTPLGLLIKSFWKDFNLDIKTEQFLLLESDRDIPKAIISFLSTANEDIETNNIVIGSIDSTNTKYLDTSLEQYNLKTRVPIGSKFTAGRVYSSLELLFNFYQSKKIEDLILLLKQNDLKKYFHKDLDKDIDFLNTLLKYQNIHFQEIFINFVYDSRYQEVLELLKTKLDNLFKNLDSFNDKTSFETFSNISFEFIKEIFKDTDFKLNKELFNEISIFKNFILDFKTNFSNKELISLKEFRELLSLETESLSLVPLEDSEAIEILGWLELNLDDSEYKFITGINSGNLPEFISNDPFMPEALRDKLGIRTNKFRYLRDKYILYSLMLDKKNIFLSSKYSLTDEKLFPSKLLFETKNKEKMVLDYFENNTQINFINKKNDKKVTTDDYFKLQIEDLNNITDISITAISSFLKNPWLFYLSRFKNLSEFKYKDELDALDYGNFIHKVLEEFFKSDFKNEIDPKVFKRELNFIIENTYEDYFAENVSVLIKIQKLTIIERLKSLVYNQIKLTKMGQKVLAIEKTISYDFNVDGQIITVKGRIDRIDQIDKETICVIDFKSSKDSKTPDQKHLDRKKEWKDLQLPFYQFVLSKDPDYKDKIIKAAYFNIPATGDSQFLLAKWDNKFLENFEDYMIDILREIKNCNLAKEDFGNIYDYLNVVNKRELNAV